MLHREESRVLVQGTVGVGRTYSPPLNLVHAPTKHPQTKWEKISIRFVLQHMMAYDKMGIHEKQTGYGKAVCMIRSSFSPHK